MRSRYQNEHPLVRQEGIEAMNHIQRCLREEFPELRQEHERDHDATWWPVVEFPSLNPLRQSGHTAGARPLKRPRASDILAHEQQVQQQGTVGNRERIAAGEHEADASGGVLLYPIRFVVSSYDNDATIMVRWALPIANAYAIKAGHALGATFRDRNVWLDSHGMKEGSCHLFWVLRALPTSHASIWHQG